MTDSLPDIQAEVHRLVGLLNPSAFLSRAAFYTRGGLPGQSMSDGRGGGEPNQGFDKDDRLIRSKKKLYESGWYSLVEEARRLVLIESWMLEIAQAVPDEPVFMCANPDCTDQLEVGLKSGECGKCRKHRSRHHLPWPKKASTVTGLRQTAVSEMLSQP